jgi:hypothetical protein
MGVVLNAFLIRRTALLALVLTLAALYFLSTTLAAPAEQGLVCATAPVSADPSPTVCLSNLVVVFDGVSPDNQFVISWRSVRNESGQVKLSSGETFDDVRGADYQGTTHYVVVSNIDAKTNYTLDVISGGKTFTNNNAHWNIRAGPAIPLGTPYVIFGRVSNPDGSDADGALVYAQIRNSDNQGTQGRSAWLSALVVVPDGGNFFNINLSAARTSNNVQHYAFSPDGDRVLIIASGPQGTVSKAFPISALHPPAPPPSLILGSSGTGVVATATATELPPTDTPTLSPTPTATETPFSPTPSETPSPLPPTETPELATETAQAEATQEQEQATREIETAETETVEPQTTNVALPAGDEVEAQPTRVFGGVPTVTPPEQSSSNLILVFFAFVLIVGAGLLGLAAFFLARNKT